MEAAKAEIKALRAKVAEMEQREPVGVLHVGSYYGEELQDWEFEANQCACDKLNEAYVRNPMSLPLYALPSVQNVPDFADAYQGAMEEVAIWKKRALEAEDLNRKFIAEINGPTHMGEPAQPAPSVPEVTDAMALAFHHVLTDGSIGTREVEEIKDALRAALAAAPEAKPCP